MMRTFEYVGDVYKQTKDGEAKLIAKNVVRHTQLEMDLIDDATEFINERGKIDWNYSVIIHRELGTLVLKFPIKELWDLRSKQNGFAVKGFDINESKKQGRNGRQQRQRTTTTGRPTRKSTK